MLAVIHKVPSFTSLSDFRFESIKTFHLLKTCTFVLEQLDRNFVKISDSLQLKRVSPHVRRPHLVQVLVEISDIQLIQKSFVNFTVVVDSEVSLNLVHHPLPDKVVILVMRVFHKLICDGAEEAVAVTALRVEPKTYLS